MLTSLTNGDWRVIFQTETSKGQAHVEIYPVNSHTLGKDKTKHGTEQNMRGQNTTVLDKTGQDSSHRSHHITQNYHQ